jgi:hypothetical protein
VIEPHERALALLDVPFRFQGRNPDTGLDCLGVVIWAFRLRNTGIARYRITEGDWNRVAEELSVWFAPAETVTGRDNDLAVFRLARSFHFGVISGGHLIHADAAIGRVVARRLPARLGRECRFFKHQGD